MMDTRRIRSTSHPDRNGRWHRSLYMPPITVKDVERHDDGHRTA